MLDEMLVKVERIVHVVFGRAREASRHFHKKAGDLQHLPGCMSGDTGNAHSSPGKGFGMGTVYIYSIMWGSQSPGQPVIRK